MRYYWLARSRSRADVTLLLQGEKLHEQRGDSVRAAVGVGVADRRRRDLADFELEQVGERGPQVQVGMEAVGAEQQAVARLHGHGEDVDLDVFPQADRAGDDVLAGVALEASLGRGQATVLDLNVEPGVVLGELGDLAVRAR